MVAAVGLSELYVPGPLHGALVAAHARLAQIPLPEKEGATAHSITEAAQAVYDLFFLCSVSSLPRSSFFLLRRQSGAQGLGTLAAMASQLIVRLVESQLLAVRARSAATTPTATTDAAAAAGVHVVEVAAQSRALIALLLRETHYLCEAHVKVLEGKLEAIAANQGAELPVNEAVNGVVVDVGDAITNIVDCAKHTMPAFRLAAKAR